VTLFRKATKSAAKIRLAIIGPSGSGKTYTALSVATHLAAGPIAVVDTERGSASKYAGQFEFDVCELTNFHPNKYIEALNAAAQAGYGVIVVDSLSHAWMGESGALDLVDKAAARSQSGNRFTAWRDVTPLQNRLIETMLQSPSHILVTMRSKQEYVIDKDERGRTQVRKVGLAPVQRDGVEYEFDLVADMDQSHNFVVSKSRCPDLTDAVVNRPGKEIAESLKAWLYGDGEAVPAGKPAVVRPAPQPAPTPPVVDDFDTPPPLATKPKPEAKAAPVVPQEEEDTRPPARQVANIMKMGHAWLKRLGCSEAGMSFADRTLLTVLGVPSYADIPESRGQEIREHYRSQWLLGELRGEAYMPFETESPEAPAGGGFLPVEDL